MRIGIDLGGTKIAGIVMDDDNETIVSRRVLTRPREGYSHIIESLAVLIEDLEKEAGLPCQIGVGTPGSISRTRGVIKNCNVACINGRPLQRDLEQRLRRKVRVANDANCFTLSEARDGAARNHDIVFGVILGTGVGGGISVGGRVLNGANDVAGEWGHMPLVIDGDACYCGRTGCVETALSGSGLLHQYRAREGGVARDAKEVAARAQCGIDRAAQEAVDAYLTLFARALASVVKVLDPHAVVLGGGLSNMDCLYTEGVRRLAQQTFSDEQETLILPNMHGDASGVRGAAMLWSAPAQVHALCSAPARAQNLRQAALP